MTVAELNVRMGASEFVEWMHYFRRHPFGPVRDNLHAAQICALFANAHRRKGSRPYTANDFLLMTDQERMQQRTKKTVGIMRTMAKPRVH